ncbi:MAG: autotransporter outer membrane beta-barrel domain-containing protein, partial [Gammaproteobacteria bacterium]|nr:autotransporter outer membrane beta-barrel domain-containing protein [Gammaproteobacteria bacterium]
MSTALAADITIASGVTVGATQTLTDEGDDLTVEAGGTIDTTGGTGTDNAVNAEADNQTIVNQGSIKGDENGIQTSASAPTIINESGALISGKDGHGIYFNGAVSVGSKLVNHGTITSAQGQGVYISENTGGGEYGGSYGRIDNYGEITGTGGQALYLSSTHGHHYTVVNHQGAKMSSAGSHGLYVGSSDGYKNTFINYGDIWSTASRGVYFSSTNGYEISLINYGNIWSTWDDGVRFSSHGAYGHRLVNHGTIYSSAANNAGVRFSHSYDNTWDSENFDNGIITDTMAEIFANNNELINHGLIYSTQWHGVQFNSTDMTEDLFNGGTIRSASGFNAINITSVMAGMNVTLLPGSVLDGGVSFGSPSDTLNIRKGLNLYLDYDDTLEAVNSEVPYVWDKTNGIVYTLDPSGVALPNLMLQSLSGAVHEAILGAVGGSAATLLAGQSSFDTGLSAGDTTSDSSAWAKVYGGIQSQDGSGQMTGAEQDYAGVVAGWNLGTDDHQYGIFVGAARSELETSYETQDIDADSFYAGLYGASQRDGYKLHFSLLGGYSQFDSERSVANNNVGGGLQTATADYDGWFISPSVTLSKAINQRTEFTLGGHYAGLFLDGYQETGSAANLKLDDRNMHLIAVRAKVDHLVLQKPTKNGMVKLNIWGGVDGSYNFGDDAEA